MKHNRNNCVTFSLHHRLLFFSRQPALPGNCSLYERPWVVLLRFCFCLPATPPSTTTTANTHTPPSCLLACAVLVEPSLSPGGKHVNEPDVFVPLVWNAASPLACSCGITVCTINKTQIGFTSCYVNPKPLVCVDSRASGVDIDHPDWWLASSLTCGTITLLLVSAGFLVFWLQSG